MSPKIVMVTFFAFTIVYLLIAASQRNVEAFQYENTAHDLVKREHGITLGDDSKLMISARMRDGIPENTTVDSECRRVKVWYYKQKESGSDIFELKNDNFSILTIGRKDDLHCIPFNSTAAIIEDIRSRELVVKRDVVKYEDEQHLMRGYEVDPMHLFPDTSIREYCAFYLGKDDTDTEFRKFDIHEELNNENSPVRFFGAPVKLGYYRNMGLGKYVGVASTFCKVALDEEVDDENKIKLYDSKYERFFKRLDENVYEIVYQNSRTKEYVGLNGITSLDDFRNKYCVMDCSKISSKQNLWRLKENVFTRTNFVDMVTNNAKSHCEQTIDSGGNIIPTSDTSIVREQDIDLERYKKNELKDIYVIRFEYNSDDFYYVRGDPKFQIPTTKCDVGYTYETVKPKRQFVDDKRWINIEDRTCVDVDPCDRVLFDDLKFTFKKRFTLDPYRYSVVEAIQVPDIPKYTHCVGVRIACNLTIRPVENVATIQPQIILRKREKELVLRAKLVQDGQNELEFGRGRDSLDAPNTVKCKGGAVAGSSNNLYVHRENGTLDPYESDDAALSWHSSWKKDVETISCEEKKLGEKVRERVRLAYMMSNLEEGDDDYAFRPFHVFKNDKFEVVVKSGSMSVELSDLEIVMKCQDAEVITTKATYSSNNSCSMQTYAECDYSGMFYDPTNQFGCKEYTKLKPGCPSSATSTADHKLCDISDKYMQSDQSLDILHHDDMPLDQHYDDCRALCDDRVGCTGVEYRSDARECVFFGHETHRIIFTGLDENAVRKVTVLYDNDRRRETDVSESHEMIFSKPVHINSVEVIGGSFKSVEFRRHDGLTQKLYDAAALKRYQHTDQFMLIDDMYTGNGVGAMTSTSHEG